MLLSQNGNTPDGNELLTERARNGWGYYVQAGYLLDKHVELTGRFGELRAIGSVADDVLP